MPESFTVTFHSVLSSMMRMLTYPPGLLYLIAFDKRLFIILSNISGSLKTTSSESVVSKFNWILCFSASSRKANILFLIKATASIRSRCGLAFSFNRLKSRNLPILFCNLSTLAIAICSLSAISSLSFSCSTSPMGARIKDNGVFISWAIFTRYFNRSLALLTSCMSLLKYNAASKKTIIIIA